MRCIGCDRELNAATDKDLVVHAAGTVLYYHADLDGKFAGRIGNSEKCTKTSTGSSMFEKWCDGGNHKFAGLPYAREVQGMRVLYFCCREHYSAWQQQLVYRPRPVIWAPPR